MSVWHEKVTHGSWESRAVIDSFLCCAERINIRDVQFAFVSPEKEGLISSYLSPYTKETRLAVKWGGDACAKHFEMQKLLSVACFQTSWLSELQFSSKEIAWVFFT